MSKLGWLILTISPIKFSGFDIEIIYFKKTIDSLELTVTIN